VKYIRKALQIIISITLFMSVFSARVYAASYTDTQGHWAENGIEALTKKGILSEIERGDNKFEPDANITRAEFFVMINNAFEFNI
jgi:hypothetical protein